MPEPDTKAARAAKKLTSQGALDEFLATYSTKEAKQAALERLRQYLTFEPKVIQ